jgi:hypothetical protein
MILLEDFVFDRDFVARRSDPVIADLGYLGSMVFNTANATRLNITSDPVWLT